MSYLGLFQLAVPETIVAAAAALVLLADAGLRRFRLRLRFGVGGLVAGLGCAGAIAWLCAAQTQGASPGGMLVVDSLTQWLKGALLVLSFATVMLSIDAEFTDHAGEYYALVLLATVGMMLLISAENILILFIALELTSVCLYILTALNRGDRRSTEAALKYFLFGGMSAAFTLFGLSYVYGLSGATHFREIALALAGKATDPLLPVAMVLVIVGFGFKVAAVPFHLWAPDAYEGAPTPSAALIASGSKVAGVFIFAKLLLVAFAGVEGSGAWRAYAPGWVPVIAVLAGLSMVLGNLAAIVQGSVRRLLAYSAIAHAGYMLLGAMAHNGPGLAALVYYAATYGLTTVGAFGVVAVVEQDTGGAGISDFAGLSRRAPVLAFCLLVFMLSLAGIPPLAGFFGKFYLFAAAAGSDGPGLGLLWLVILAIAMSTVSLYYYLQVLKQAYVSEPKPDRGRLRVPMARLMTLCALAVAVVLFGCAPWLILEYVQQALAGW